MVDSNNLQKLDETSPSIQTHLGISQGVIQRMADNSTSSKAWCITIVSAILVIVADKGKPLRVDCSNSDCAVCCIGCLLFGT